MPKITIYVPDQAPMKFGIDDQIEVNIGRAGDNDIVIDHDSISSHHAKLKLHGDHYHLVDLDSTNGTFVDGAEASNVLLHDGVRITFGEVDAAYEDADDDADAGGETEFETESEGSGFENTIHAEIAADSAAPATFRNLSPIVKPEKKDVFSKVAMTACILALATAAAVVAFGAMMRID